MIIGDTVKIKDSPFYAPHLQGYIGQSGTIIEIRIIGKFTRYKIQFADGHKIWFFEPELISLWSEQKRRHQEDFFKTDNQVEQARLKAGIILCL